MATVLLSSVFRPFGIENRYNKKHDEHLLDYLSSRLTREPGLFALSSYVPNTGLHLIAANLPAQTRVLEWPSVDEFVQELKKEPDYVGISFVIKGFGKVAKMIALTRKYAPRAKIIVGGFGTALTAVNDLEPDYISTGEGVRFMRNVMGVPAELPIAHPKVSADITLKCLRNYDYFKKPKIGFITSGFGCPHACDFCSTSAYFGYRSISLLSDGRAMYEAMKSQCRESGGEISTFLIYEEDLMLFKSKVREMGELIEMDQKDDLTYSCFATVKALAQQDPEKLVAQGLDHVWIGVESVNAPYAKRKGMDIKALFDQLHAVGATTTGSIVFGLDHHTPEELPKEVDFLCSMRPSTAQIANLMPASGTKLRERWESEGRIRESGYKDADLFSEVVTHPNFRQGELRDAVFDGYVRLYESIGPSVFRMFDTWLAGYKNLRGSSVTSLRRRAQGYCRRLRAMLPLFWSTASYLPNDEIRRQVAATVEEVIAETGALTTAQEGEAELIAHVFAIEDARFRQFGDAVIEPEPIVRDFPPYVPVASSEVDCPVLQVIS